MRPRIRWALSLALATAFLPGCGNGKSEPSKLRGATAEPKAVKAQAPPPIAALQFVLPLERSLITSPVTLRVGGAESLLPAQIFADGKLIATVTNTTENLEWKAALGEHSLTIVDRTGTRTKPLRITVRGNAPPLIRPLFGRKLTYQPQIILCAKVTDPDSDVTRVTFRGGINFLGDAPPDKCEAIWVNPPLGKQAVIIEAYDKAGHRTVWEQDVLIDFSGGLVGFWDGEHGLQSGTANHVALTSGVCREAFEFFPGGSITTGKFNLTTGFTWCAWIYLPSQPTGRDVVFSKWRENENSQLSYRGVVLPDRTFAFSMADRWNQQNPNFHAIRTTSQLPLRQWVHVTCTYNGTTGHRAVWFNGSPVVQQQEPPTSLFASDVPFVLGDAANKDILRLDDIGLYSRALTETELQLIVRNRGTSISPE